MSSNLLIFFVLVFNKRRLLLYYQNFKIYSKHTILLEKKRVSGRLNDLVRVVRMTYPKPTFLTLLAKSFGTG